MPILRAKAKVGHKGIVVLGNDVFNFGSGVVLWDEDEWVAHSWPVTLFKDRFLVCPPHQKPEATEDWKAKIWMYGGPKPSYIKEVHIKISTDTKHMVIFWTEKDGIQPEQNSSRASTPVARSPLVLGRENIISKQDTK